MSHLPDFATNSGPDGLRVADAVNRLFSALSENKVTPPPVAIATAYINPGGFVLLADELEKAPRVRLLLGAEPDEDTVRALVPPPVSDRDARLAGALAQHDAWVRQERDMMGFERRSNAEAHRMVDWLRSTGPDGAPRVEVRRYAAGFLHGKTYLVQDQASPAALAGSSNMTYAGLALNAELNLGTGGGTPSASQVQAWFDTYWEASEPYDLAGLYADLWTPHSPWEVFLRMLWELYGASLDEEKPATPLGPLTRFQADGVARMKRLLDELGGVLVADEVGLGKTFLAGEVIQQANEVNRQRVLVVAPASLKKSMWDPFLDKRGFSRLTQVYSYEQVRNRLNPPDDDQAALRERREDWLKLSPEEHIAHYTARGLPEKDAMKAAAKDRGVSKRELYAAVKQ